mgnify:CR=1 FL=1
MTSNVVMVIIDIVCTIWEAIIGAYLIRIYAKNKISFRADSLWLCLFVASVEFMTFLSIPPILKVLIQWVISSGIIILIYKIRIMDAILSYEILLFVVCISETIVTVILNLLRIEFLYSGSNYIFFQAEWYFISHATGTLLALALKACFKNLLSGFKKRENILLFFLLGSIILLITSTGDYVNNEWLEIAQIIKVVALLAFCVVLCSLVYFINDSIKVRFKQQKEEYQLKELQAQYQYYEERLKDEQRVRGIYHDMKNHLLVLQAQLKEIGNTGDQEKKQETEEMITKIRNQISDYEDYVQTGNAFLDVILRDKLKKAKEESIDFHTEIDFSKGNFIDALDISTIFGNALDNAIEACEKVPEEERFITMKAGERNHFLVIHIENSAVKEEAEKKTTKEDTFLHGFGLKNIQRAAEKYGGQCKRNYQSGVYMLSILIPIAEK